jgi:hypothetical protein
MSSTEISNYEQNTQKNIFGYEEHIYVLCTYIVHTVWC